MAIARAVSVEPRRQRAMRARRFLDTVHSFRKKRTIKAVPSHSPGWGGNRGSVVNEILRKSSCVPLCFVGAACLAADVRMRSQAWLGRSREGGRS